MNFLFIYVNNSIMDIPMVLPEMGHTVTVLDHHPFDPLNLTAKEPLLPIEAALRTQDFDYVITYLFVPIISDLCEKYRTTYISWIYDSPLVSVFHNSILNSVNRIFLFDRTFYNRLVQIGIPHVHYMPLAANTERIQSLELTEEDRERFSCDISFVGSLYEKNDYNHLAPYLPPEVILPINRYLLHNLCNWSSVRSWPLLPDVCVSYLTEKNSIDLSAIQSFQLPASMYLGISIECRKLAEMERITALNTLAESFKVDLYTSGKSDQIDILSIHPPVNYYIEQYKVFRFSRINLNLTLPSIETGAPQRIYDILAAGGFLLSNYQKEYEDLFELGKDFVAFRDLGELKEQTAYYLAHEQERKEIAAHGQQTVNRLYSLKNQLTRMLQICEAEKND